MKRLFGAIVLILAVLIVSIPQTFANTIYACIDNKGADKGDMRLVDGPGKCKSGEYELSWQEPDAIFGQNTNQAAQGRSGADCTLGEIMLTAGSVANGMPASGQILPISQWQALFSLLGTKYGGNGTSTFALPDLRAVAPNGLTYSICIYGLYPSRD